MDQKVLPNPRDVIIENLATTAIAGNVYHNTAGNSDLNSRLDPIHDASHTRDRKTSPPDSQCLPGTRTKVLDMISKWAETSLLFNRSHIYWLYGYVGCGKSSISQAVAERFHQKGRLIASFFFFRSSERRSSFKSFPATLAWQLATAIPATAPFIMAASSGDLSSLSVGAQMELLVYNPLSTVMNWGVNGFGITSLLKPFLITIDGLDECKDQDRVAEFIDHALCYFKEHPRFPLRFFIASRVEEHIRTRLDCDGVCLDNLTDHPPHEDILEYIHTVFKDVRKHNRVIRAYGEWPGTENVESLAKISGGSFIFISMLLRYILSSVNGDERTPKEPIPLALDMNSGLDHLYAETLGRSRDLPHFSSIISTIAYLQKPFSTSEIAEFLDIELYEVTAVLINLHSIIHLPGDDITPVTLCHTSLQDFLTTKSRSGQFYAPPIHHRNMALQCIHLIIFYHQTLIRGSFALLFALEYAKRHLYTHFELSLSPPDHLDTRQHLYIEATTYLTQKFSDFSLVISTWMMMERMGDRRYPFEADAVAGFLGSTVPDAWLIIETLHSVMDSDHCTKDDTEKLGFWKACLMQPHPALLDLSHHTFLTKQCIHCFSAERPSYSNFSSIMVLEYACTNWVFHLKMSVAHDPTIDAKFLQDIGITPASVQDVYQNLIYLEGRRLLDDILICSTVTAIETRFPETKMSDYGKWAVVTGPHPKGRLYPGGGIYLQGKYPVSFMDLLYAFGQLLKGDADQVDFVDEQGSIVFAITMGI